MQKKVVLITGGSTGLGKAIGIFLKQKGFEVYGTTRDPSRYPDFNDFRLVALDVRNTDSISEAVQTIISEQGQIDVLVNNAGVGITGPLEEIPEDEIRNHFSVNFYGPVEVIRSVLPQMRQQGSGLIINVTSIAAYMGLPYRSIYSASKAALEIITESLRMEVKDFGIRVANLAPAEFATNIAAGRYHEKVKEDSPYKVPYQNTLRLMNEHVDSGENPEMVARKVYSIIMKDNPRIHYKVGRTMQKASVFIKRILPDKLFEKLLINHYKL